GAATAGSWCRREPRRRSFRAPPRRRHPRDSRRDRPSTSRSPPPRPRRYRATAAAAARRRAQTRTPGRRRPRSPAPPPRKARPGCGWSGGPWLVGRRNPWVVSRSLRSLQVAPSALQRVRRKEQQPPQSTLYPLQAAQPPTDSLQLARKRKRLASSKADLRRFPLRRIVDRKLFGGRETSRAGDHG